MNATTTRPTCPHPRCCVPFYPKDGAGWWCSSHGTFYRPERVVVTERWVFPEQGRLPL